jgi:hypothetical protein
MKLVRSAAISLQLLHLDSCKPMYGMFHNQFDHSEIENIKKVNQNNCLRPPHIRTVKVIWLLCSPTGKGRPQVQNYRGGSVYL